MVHSVYKYINIAGFVIRDLQNEKRDHPHLLHSPPSEVEGVKIVVISFRNIAKKKKYVAIKRQSQIVHKAVNSANPALIVSEQ